MTDPGYEIRLRNWLDSGCDEPYHLEQFRADLGAILAERVPSTPNLSGLPAELERFAGYATHEQAAAAFRSAAAIVRSATAVLTPLAPYYERMQQFADNVRPVEPRACVVPMGEPFNTQPLPIADTELDDEIEQILGRFLDDSLERIHARNAICAALLARGFDIYARRTR